MGHDLPEGAWPQVIEAIESNARRAGVAVGADADAVPA
jgi:hypothetical protein